MKEVNNYSLRTSSFVFVGMFLFNFICIIKITQLKQKSDFKQAIASIEAIRGYQGLIFDHNSYGGMILGILEKSHGHHIVALKLSKKNNQEFSRNFSNNEANILSFILNERFFGTLDEYDVAIEFYLTNLDIFKVAFYSFLIATCFTGTFLLYGRLRQKELALMLSERLSQASEQVAHDIRSPLASLEILSTNLERLPKETQLIIRNSIERIKDIANTLSSKKLITKMTTTAVSDQRNEQPVLLSNQIERLVTEKRIQIKSNLNINIQFHQNELSYGLFSKVDPTELNRALSNLVDNAVEAVGIKGHIEILLTNKGEYNKISIRDNGQGVPQDRISELGKRGNTFNKKSGTGLGLFHAKEFCEQLSGKLLIESTEGLGTTVSLTMPKCPTPAWFAREISFEKTSTFIILDDDRTIHHLWAERFRDKNNLASPLKVYNFFKSNELRALYRENYVTLENAFFLIDNVLSEEVHAGLDLIEQLGIQKSSFLVTSHFEEQFFLEACMSKGIKILPKNLLMFVPIQVS